MYSTLVRPNKSCIKFKIEKEKTMHTLCLPILSLVKAKQRITNYTARVEINQNNREMYIDRVKVKDCRVRFLHSSCALEEPAVLPK